MSRRHRSGPLGRTTTRERRTPITGRPEPIAFPMRRHPGGATEVRRRREPLRPKLAALLRQSGVSDGSIFRNEASSSLPAVHRRAPDHARSRRPGHPVMRRWWRHMADIMEMHGDGAPVAVVMRLAFPLG